MRVYIDQNACTGTAVCEALVPEVFFVSAEGMSNIRVGADLAPDGGAPAGVEVAPGQEDAVREAAASCPGAAIRLIEG